jgi:hypothetical protein
MTFDGVRPAHAVCTTNGRAGKKGGQSDARMSTRSNEAHFYLQYRKVGLLHSRTNYAKHIDFLVAARWIMNNWKSRTLTYEYAREEVIAGRDRVKNTLIELDFQHTLHIKETQQARQAHVKCMLRLNLLEFREWPAEVHQWKAQYHDRHWQIDEIQAIDFRRANSLGKNNVGYKFFWITLDLGVAVPGCE